MAARVDIHRGEVASVAGDGSVTLGDGTVVRADRVLICAGVQTAALFGPLGVEFAPHIRFTYQGADATGAACLSAPEGYGLPLGSTGRWAFGQEVPDPATVRALFPTLTPVGQVDSVTVRAERRAAQRPDPLVCPAQGFRCRYVVSRRVFCRRFWSRRRAWGCRCRW